MEDKIVMVGDFVRLRSIRGGALYVLPRDVLRIVACDDGAFLRVAPDHRVERVMNSADDVARFLSEVDYAEEGGAG